MALTEHGIPLMLVQVAKTSLFTGPPSHLHSYLVITTGLTSGGSLWTNAKNSRLRPDSASRYAVLAYLTPAEAGRVPKSIE